MSPLDKRTTIRWDAPVFSDARVVIEEPTADKPERLIDVVGCRFLVARDSGNRVANSLVVSLGLAQLKAQDDLANKYVGLGKLAVAQLFEEIAG
jgi:hypothetical protein